MMGLGKPLGGELDDESYLPLRRLVSRQPSIGKSQPRDAGRLQLTNSRLAIYYGAISS